MKIIDLHQDLLLHIRYGEQYGQSVQTSYQMLEASDIDTVIVTAFPNPPSEDQYDPSVHELITEELEMYREQANKHENWQLILKAIDLESNNKKLLLHVEGLNVFEGSEADWKLLDVWRGIGLRSIGTHWNLNNKLGGGTLDTNEPLTDLGREVIHYLEYHNMIFDMAHIGRQAFADAAHVTTRPLYISHGNADQVCSSVRNYTDQQLKQIAETDGVIGIFFSSKFVVGKDKRAKIEDVIAHIEHIKSLIGVRHIAIGSDFGGILSPAVESLTSIEDFPNLFASLHEIGYAEDDIEAIAYSNAKRLLKAHLG